MEGCTGSEGGWRVVQGVRVEGCTGSEGGWRVVQGWVECHAGVVRVWVSKKGPRGGGSPGELGGGVMEQ